MQRAFLAATGMVPYNKHGAYSIAYIMWLEETAEQFAEALTRLPLDNKDTRPDNSGKGEST